MKESWAIAPEIAEFNSQSIDPLAQSPAAPSERKRARLETVDSLVGELQLGSSSQTHRWSGIPTSWLRGKPRCASPPPVDRAGLYWFPGLSRGENYRPCSLPDMGTRAR